MHISNHVARWLLVLLALGLTACASVRSSEDLSDYDDALRDLRRQAVDHPEDPEPFQKMGIIYMRTGAYSQANENLEKAFARDRDDPKTLYYLALSNEKLNKTQTALRLYGQYEEVPSDSPYRSLMEGRYGWLTREVAREEMQELLASEDTLSANRLVPHAVAVFPLTFQGDEQRYAPIGRGLAEMLSVDLSNVKGLIVVERVRLQALLNELEFARSEYVDPQTAPRVGMLLAAGRIVGGAYAVQDETLRIDASLWDTERASMPEFEEQRGTLRNYFRLQKQLAFALLDQMGIELTQEEREEIEYIPTENLQAFLAYSRGLEQEDVGNFEAAAQFYREASQLDPEFQEATDKAEASDSIAEVAGTFGTALGAALEIEPPIQPVSTIDPLLIRTRNLNENIGSFIVPGLDDREPGAEATASDAPLGGLPDPPPPPRDN
ncbi:MAG: hypothetical protein GVY18_15985 [Bacteroidetes bacterium]|jgi:tetratricopeptide (TPR) repeat protein|nr:hypothetical protein [Bacteroidota bacterium]